MIIHSVLTRALLLLSLALIPSLSPNLSLAQNKFQSAITVNDGVITHYEIEQRMKLLAFFNTPSASKSLAQTQLIEDRLKASAMKRDNFSTPKNQLDTAIDSFSQRANLSTAELARALKKKGIAFETLRDFVNIGVSWRDYIRARFGPQTAVSEGDINQAIAQALDGSQTIEVLLSEIIIPIAPPQITPEMAQNEAKKTAKIRSFEAFSNQARRVSALPSRDNGGRLGWRSITTYPPAIQTILRTLKKGEVTQPIPIPNGIALFQMRGIREASQDSKAQNATDYAQLTFPLATTAALQELSLRIDTCQDLYGEAKRNPNITLTRKTALTQELPSDLALELARLDEGEFSVSSQEGQPSLIMLCERKAQTENDIDRGNIENQLRSRNLASFAQSLLEKLRASATIVTQ